MQELNTYISRMDYSGIIEFFITKGRKQILCKKECFVNQNAISYYAAYVQKGIFHYTCISDDGEEHVVGYSFEKKFICDYASFVKGGNSLVSIQAITDSTIYVISLDDYMEYADSIQNGGHFGYQVANALFEMYYQRLLELYCDTPEKRYIKLMKRCPDLKEKISLKEIASFLGVSPETISHIRKKLLYE